jgi:RNA polymerase sigma factor (sigma-70 family)
MSDVGITGPSHQSPDPAPIPGFQIELWTAEIRAKAKHLAGRFHVSARDLTDDLEQAGLIAFLRATHAYRQDRGKPFANYVRRAVRNAMTSRLRALFAPDGLLAACALDVIFANQQFSAPKENRPDNHYERIEMQSYVSEWVRSLPPRVQEIYGLVYEQGLTQREVANRTGISQPRVSQIHRQLVERGKQELAALVA